MTSLAVLAVASLLAWLGALTMRGRFWRCDQRLGEDPASPASWPAVVAVIPARNEAPTIAAAVSSLTRQEYAGDLAIVVVDDESTDGTGERARSAGACVVKGSPLAPGWTGKVWAQAQGIAAADARWPDARWLLLTDADIVHDRSALRRLVAKAEADGLDLASLMVALACRSLWERLLIPPFVFFFQKLYPFPWVNDPARATAAAAGGCMLVRRAALAAAGGMTAIRDRLIDDCALAKILKRNGRIWLGLSDETKSVRRYERLADLWSMVARTAYTQLDHRPLLLLGTVLGMSILYLVPPVATAAGAVSGDPLAAGAGAVAWLAMATAMRPTALLYGRPAWSGLMLPLAALLYTLMTIDSAGRQWFGDGGAWKGRRYGKLQASRG